MYSLIGILGGIGVGLSATYGWQAVFNSWGAMSIAMTFLGVGGAIFTVSLIMHLELSMHWFLSAVFYRYGLDCRSKEKACFRLKWKRAFSFILISFEILTVKADSYDHSKKFSGRKCQPDSGASKEYRKNINKCHHQNTSS